MSDIKDLEADIECKQLSREKKAILRHDQRGMWMSYSFDNKLTSPLDRLPLSVKIW